MIHSSTVFAVFAKIRAIQSCQTKIEPRHFSLRRQFVIAVIWPTFLCTNVHWKHISMYSSEFRRAVLSVYQYIQSMRRVGQILKVASSTIHRWIRGAEARKGWPCRGSKFTDAMVSLVELQLRRSPETTASQLQAMLRMQLGVNIRAPSSRRASNRRSHWPGQL